MPAVSLGRVFLVPALLGLAVAGCGRSPFHDDNTDPGTVTVQFRFPTVGALAPPNYGGYSYFDLTLTGDLEFADGYKPQDDTGDTSVTAMLTAHTSGPDAITPPGLVTFSKQVNLKRGWWAFDISVTAGPNHEQPMHRLCVNVLVRPDRNTTVKFTAEVVPPNADPVVTCTYQDDG